MGFGATVAAIAVALFASGMDARDPNLGPIGQSWVLANLPLIGVWLLALALAVIAAYSFRAANRFRRIGIGIAAEELKLRNDPRFTEAWVQHIKTQAPPAPDSGTPPRVPSARERIDEDDR